MMDEALVGRSLCHYGRCDDEGATNAENTLLILSNLVFLLPITTAVRRRFPVMAAWIVWTAVASIFHHLCIGDIACMFDLSCHEWRMADHFFAYGAVALTFVFLLQFDQYDRLRYYYAEPDPKRNGRITYREINGITQFGLWFGVLFGLLFAVILMVARNPTDPHNALVLAMLLIATFIFKTTLVPYGNINVMLYDWRWLLAAAAVAATGIVFFYLDTKIAYWISHSIWHILIAVGLDFLLRARARRLYVDGPIATPPWHSAYKPK